MFSQVAAKHGETVLLGSSERLTGWNHRTVARSFGREGFTCYDSFQAAVWGSPCARRFDLFNGPL